MLVDSDPESLGIMELLEIDADKTEEEGPTRSGAGIFPAELIFEIVRAITEDFVPGERSTPWLRSLATIARAWKVPIQRALFRQIKVDRDFSRPDRAVARLHFLADQPHLAAHVVKLYVDACPTRVPQTEIITLLRAALPRVHSLDIHVAASQFLGVDLVALINAFPLLLHLRLREYWTAYGALDQVPDVRLLSLELTGSLVEQRILQEFASSPSRGSLQKARIQHLDIATAGFELCTSNLSHFFNLNALEITIEDRSRGTSVVYMSGISLAHYAHLTSLALRIFIAPFLAVRVLRGLFASASLPALRNLKLEITLEQGRGNLSREFMPFDDGHGDALSRAPILSAAISDGLDNLELRFVNRLLAISDSDAFFSLFGLQERPGVLQVTGNGMQLL